MGHRTASDYGKFALEAAKIMKLVDPSIKVVAAGAADLRGDWVGWNRTVLDILKDHVEYLSLHLYVGNKENNYEEFVASSLELQNLTKTAEGIIRAALLNAQPNRQIFIAWDEWNVWYRERGKGKETGRHILEERYNLEDALVIATFLNTFLNNAHIVKIANLAQLVNVIAPIFTNDKGLFLQTIYYPLQLFANNSKGNALELAIESPTYSSQKWGAVPYLDISAAHDNGSLVINVVNRHRTEALEAEFEPQDAQFSNSFEVAEVNGPDIKSENNFESQPVGIKRSSAQVSNNRLIYRFPPHSYTMLKGRMA
jgi:alpha-N-arabinofuranosidase